MGRVTQNYDAKDNRSEASMCFPLRRGIREETVVASGYRHTNRGQKVVTVSTALRNTLFMVQPISISKSIGARGIKCEFDKCIRLMYYRWKCTMAPLEIGLQCVDGIDIGSMVHHGILVHLVLDFHNAQMQQLLYLPANGQDSLYIARVLRPKGCKES